MKKQTGFTMVELMIVVAIIAVLASIIMPKMSGARNSAKLNACKANLRHIAVAMSLYNTEYTFFTPNTGSTEVTYVDCNYLIPNYLKATPRCVTGHRYAISAPSPSWRAIPAGAVRIYCYDSAGCHAGLADNCPYTWIGGPIKDN